MPPGDWSSRQSLRGAELRLELRRCHRCCPGLDELPGPPPEPALALDQPVRYRVWSRAILPRQERSSQTFNHGTTPPYGRELPPGRTRKREVDSVSLFRVFRWIPWLLSDPSGAAIGCCWTESTVRICADLGCRGNTGRSMPG